MKASRSSSSSSAPHSQVKKWKEESKDDLMFWVGVM